MFSLNRETGMIADEIAISKAGISYDRTSGIRFPIASPDLPTALTILVCSLLTFASFDSSLAAEVDFAQIIQPIFERHCIRCHASDIKKGNFSLSDSGDLLTKSFVIPGEPDNSYLLDLIESNGNQPPEMPKSGQRLTASEVDAVRQWIAAGAHWPDSLTITGRTRADQSWWAYQSLANRRPPAITASSTSTHTIDRWIDARLTQSGMSRSQRADRRTLIRRLSFDLHGLPPSPDQIDAYLNDTSDDAYERLVDRMLASPRYGERFAQHWLDLAHYADTHGFERDKRRDNAWRYRDYVIRSFNTDKPYDRFLQEQIAGDVLWPESDEAVIATGFLAAGPWDFVGQVETGSQTLRRAARSLDLDDIATQVMATTSAMTINCARCHDHKLDPISQKEYYQLRAVFAGLERTDRVVSELRLQEYESSRQEIQARINKAETEIAQLQGRGLDLADIVGGGNGFGTGERGYGIDPRTAEAVEKPRGALDNVHTNTFQHSDHELIDGVCIPDGGTGETETTISSTGLKIRGLPDTSGNAWDAIRNGPVASQHSPELGGIDFTSESHSLLGLHANAAITFDLNAARRQLSVEKNRKRRVPPKLPSSDADQTLRFTARAGYFGASGGHRADLRGYLDGRLAFEFPRLRRDDGLKPVDITIPRNARFLTLVSTDGQNGYGMDQIGLGDPRLTFAAPVELTAEAQLKVRQSQQSVASLKTQLKKLEPPPNFYGVRTQTELPVVKLLERGNPESPKGPSLAPRAPSILRMLNPAFGHESSDLDQRRVQLARWITDRANPLTPRVIVNRLWQWHFGTGLVETSSDFGFGGEVPSHPELLDWLALELIQQEWSLKSMHRLIVTSETYQQSSRFDVSSSAATDASESNDGGGKVSAWKVDSDNRMLWRQNPRRLEAESIRDSVLSVSGKLNFETSGPGFEDFDYEEAYAPIYRYMTADSPDLWRRSIYRFVVRTTPNKFLTTFDCPDPANLTARRTSTTTPLQSLALFNNEFVLKQAEYFAERLKRETGTDSEQSITRAYLLAYGRTPTPDELRIAVGVVEKNGLFTMCRAILNSNEFLYVD